MKASREGFVGKKAISLLGEVVRFGIDWATVYRDYYIRLKEQESLIRVREEFQKISTIPAIQYEAPHSP